MPWCDGCSKFWNPNTVPSDGRCPSCSSPLATKVEPEGSGARDPDAELDYPKAPWHFKVLVVMTVIYLGWRVVQLVGSVL